MQISLSQSPIKRTQLTLTLITGDHILIKTLRHKDLQPRGTGPFQIILTTPTAAKLAGHSSLFHISRLKQVPGLSISAKKHSLLRHSLLHQHCFGTHQALTGLDS